MGAPLNSLCFFIHFVTLDPVKFALLITACPASRQSLFIFSKKLSNNKFSYSTKSLGFGRRGVSPVAPSYFFELIIKIT